MAYCLEIDGYGARQILKYCVTHVKSWMDSLVGREFKFKLNFHEKKLAVIFFYFFAALEPREELQTGLSLMDGSQMRIEHANVIKKVERRA